MMSQEKKRCDFTKSSPQHCLKEHTNSFTAILQSRKKNKWNEALRKASMLQQVFQHLQPEMVLINILFQKFRSKLDISKRSNYWKIQNGHQIPRPAHKSLEE